MTDSSSSDGPNSDNSVDEADLIPATAALSEMWFKMDLNRDGFSTQEEMKQVFSALDNADGTADGKL